MGKVKNQNGMVLVTVLIIGIIMMMFAFTLASISLVEVKSGNYAENNTQAYYIAKSTAEAVSIKIMSMAEEDLNNLIGKKNSGSMEDGLYSVVVSRDGEKDLIVTATGTINNVSETINLKLIGTTIDDENSEILSKFDMALFSDLNITMNSDSQITGNVGTNSTQNKTVKLMSNAIIKGDLFVGPDISPSYVLDKDSSAIITGTLGNIDEVRTYDSFAMPEFPTDFNTQKENINLDETSSYIIDKNICVNKNIELDGDSNITINTSTQDIIIRADNICLNSNAYIKIIGDKNVTIYTNSFQLDSNSTINKNGNTDQLLIVCNSELSLNSNSQVYGNIIHGNSNISFDSNALLSGSLLTNTSNSLNLNSNFTIDSNIIYAPNAIVTLDSNVQVYGSIIAKELIMNSNSKIYYRQPLIDEYFYLKYLIDNGGGISFSKAYWYEE